LGVPRAAAEAANAKNVATFACITGWAVRRKTLPLEWRRMDWSDRMVRLEPSLSAMGTVGYKTETIYRRYAASTLVAARNSFLDGHGAGAQPSR
jgi:hypothetical protein